MPRTSRRRRRPSATKTKQLNGRRQINIKEIRDNQKADNNRKNRNPALHPVKAQINVLLTLAAKFLVSVKPRRDYFGIGVVSDRAHDSSPPASDKLNSRRQINIKKPRDNHKANDEVKHAVNPVEATVYHLKAAINAPLTLVTEILVALESLGNHSDLGVIRYVAHTSILHKKSRKARKFHSPIPPKNRRLGKNTIKSMT